MNLIELVEAGDVRGVLDALRALTLEERAAQAAELDAHFVPQVYDGWPFHGEQRDALAAATMGSRATPQDAADWLALTRQHARDCGWMVDVASLFPLAWRAELVECIAALPWWGVMRDLLFETAEHIILDTGCPLPDTDRFIAMWLERRRDRRWRYPRPAHVLGGSHGADLLSRLRNDTFTPTLLPLAVVRPEVDISECRKELVAFAAKGVVDRDALSLRTVLDLARDTPAGAVARRALAGETLSPDEEDLVARTRVELVEPLVARLLQDGTPKAVEQPLTLLRALALTPDENARLVRDHIAMLDMSPQVAAYGQEVLISLDEAGLLEDEVRTEMCERVLLRPEKTIVRAQLSWLDRVAKRDGARAGRLLVDAALTFQHPDVDLQERSLDVVARHVRAADDRTLVQLREAAASLSPSLAARAADLFGPPGSDAAEPPTEVQPDVLPDAPEPAPVHPIETAPDVATEVAVLLANREDVVAFERALDGLVRHARLDRSTLSKALEPVLRKQPEPDGWFEGWTPIDLYDVAAAVAGVHRQSSSLDDREERYRSFRHTPIITPHGAMLKARIVEAIDVIESGVQPYLLALPTRANGVLDAATLVARIAEFEGLGVTPAPIDLAQALLRVTPTADKPTLDAAGALRSDAGRQLTQWLSVGGVAHQDTTPANWPVGDPASAKPGRWEPANPSPEHDLPLPPLVAELLGPFGMRVAHASSYWTAQLPHHRDTVAAHFGNSERRRLLPWLMATNGPAGYATHWQIAFRLGGDPREADTVVDALLVLAAQGQLDARLLAGQWQALLRMRIGTHTRAVAVLRAAAETGAWATVWSILEAALPALLRDKPVTGAGAILALAVECATRCGAKGSIPEIDELAARKGSSQTVKAARLLHDALR